MSSAATNSVSSLVQSLGDIPPEVVVFGYSEAMQALRERLAKIAAANGFMGCLPFRKIEWPLCHAGSNLVIFDDQVRSLGK